MNDASEQRLPAEPAHSGWPWPRPQHLRQHHGAGRLAPHAKPRQQGHGPADAEGLRAASGRIRPATASAHLQAAKQASAPAPVAAGWAGETPEP